MKKLFTSLLALITALSLCSCTLFNSQVIEDDGTGDEDTLIVDSTPSTDTQEGDGSATKQTAAKHKTVKTDVIVKVQEEKADTKAEKEATSPALSATVTKREGAIKTEQFYQYNTLSSAQKKAYEIVCKSIEKADNVINIDTIGLTLDQAKQMLIRLIVDNPQYFWLTKQNKITYLNNSKKVSSIILYYSDGTVADELDSNLKLTKTASRSVIDGQIKQFNSAVSSVVKACNKGDNLLTEKAFHDYIVNTVKYNSAISSSTVGAVLPHDYNAYGALCKKSAVCEGYVKAFQYLCLQSGINCTQIMGESNKSGHMWSAVNINGAWYQTDVTWDDMDSQNGVYYGYFNLTKAQMCADHTIDYTSVSVPECNSTAAAYHDNFSVLIANEYSEPTNYQKAIDNLVKMGDEYLTFKFSGTPKAPKTYFAAYVYDNYSVINKYIASKGYKITVTKESFYYDNDCYYIKVVRV